MRPILTRSFNPAVGSCLSPQVQEVSWVAWKLDGVSTRMVTDESAVRRAAQAFDDLVVVVGLPGAAAIITEIDHRPVAPEAGTSPARLRIRLGIGSFGPLAATIPEAAAAALVAEQILGADRLPFAFTADDPCHLLDVPEEDVDDAIIVRAPFVTSEPRTQAAITTVARRGPQLNPWRKVAQLVASNPSDLRIRATTIVIDAPVDFNATVDHNADALNAAGLQLGPRDNDVEIERAKATNDLARLARRAPMLCTEIALTSSQPIPHITARALAACFTTPPDVTRFDGPAALMGSSPFTGGFDLQRPAPSRFVSALRSGLPLCGGLEPPAGCDLHGLAESVIGWPIPEGDQIPTVPSAVTLRRRRPVGLDEGLPLGTDPTGAPVSVPWSTAARHTLVLGASGTAKTRLVELWARDHLAHGSPIYLIAPHRRVAQRVLAEAERLGRPVHYFHVRDARSERISPFPRIGAFNRERVAHRCRDLAWAVAAHVDDPQVAGFVYLELASAILTAASAFGADIASMAAWVNDTAHLRHIADHPALDAHTRHTLLNLALHSGQDLAAKRDWVISKLGPLVGPARGLFAQAGEGVDLHEAMNEGVSVIVNLDGLARSDAAVIGTLVIDQLLAAGLELPDDEERRRPLFVDEAHRFHPHHLEKALAEGRKTGLGVLLATQSLAQLRPALADLALAAAVRVALRQTPDSAVRLAPLLEIPAGALVDQPDFHAYVRASQEPTCAVRLPPYDDDLVLVEPEPPGPLPTVATAPPPIPNIRPSAAGDGTADPDEDGPEPTAFFDEWQRRRSRSAPLD